MNWNQTVIQCCCHTACGHGGLASRTRARVRHGVTVFKAQPSTKPHKDSQSGWTGPRPFTCPACGPAAIFSDFPSSSLSRLTEAEGSSSPKFKHSSAWQEFPALRRPHRDRTRKATLHACFWNQKGETTRLPLVSRLFDGWKGACRH